MRRALLAAPLALGVVGASAAAARADTPPSVWDVARDPGEAGSWKLHVGVQRLLLGRRDAPNDEEKLRVEAARALLEDADAAHSPDVRLRFDLGVVYGDLEQQSRVVAVLVPALAMAPPDDPASTPALEKLAYAYAKLGRSAEELEVWRRYIPRLDDRARALEMMNMGEAEMRLGHLDDALGTFREVLRLCGEVPNFTGVVLTYALTLWDLAVALDRSGDPRGALETAGKAMALSWQQGPGPLRSTMTGAQAIEDTEAVFFVPEWERQWYLALESAEAARGSSDPREAAGLWMVSVGHREAYVAGASSSPSADPWLPVAKRRLEEARAASALARKRAAKAPPPSAGRVP
jgi:tetratricopeptide (TPR) repeat protein